MNLGADGYKLSGNIQVIIADDFFKFKIMQLLWKIKDLKLSERIYKCECGNVIDRDLQQLNLKKYGEVF